VKKNVGPDERVARAILGTLAIGLGLTVGRRTWWGIVLDALGALTVLSATTGFCHVYKTFGLCSMSERADTAGGVDADK
jgi:hypothetical protein